MAYYSELYQHTSRYSNNNRRFSFESTYATGVYHSMTPLTANPLDLSPHSRPFTTRSVATPPPSPPPSHVRFMGSLEDPEEHAYKAANEAWVARQLELYALPGADLSPEELRRCNGRCLLSPKPKPSAVGAKINGTAQTVKTALTKTVDVFRAKIAREKEILAACHKEFSFWTSRANYHFINHRRQAAFELREIAARIKLALLIALFIFALGMGALKIAMLVVDPFEDSKLQGEIVYSLVKEPKSWCVAGSS
jgi:hypothetical protein